MVIKMEPTASVSKGVFVFNNGFDADKQTKKKNNTPLFEKCFHKEPWYITYKKNWKRLEEQLKDLHHRTYDTLLVDIVNYIKTLYNDREECMGHVIPSATLLTGVNQPDHMSQFTTLIYKLREEVSPHVAMVHSQDATSIKQLVENVVWQLIHGHKLTNNMSSEDDNSDVDMSPKKSQNSKIKKSHCTMATLLKWYKNKYDSPTKNKVTSQKKVQNHRTQKALVVIIPDFESFNCSILQDFVLIISSYTWSLPVVLVFGVATSVSALHKSFPYHVSSKLLIRVFQSYMSPVYMNQIVEQIFLDPKCPFQLSGKAMQLLTDVFLFYDFSVTGFVQAVKYCMMDHYYGDNIKSLCCGRDDVPDAVAALDAESLEDVRRLPSFRPHLEKQHCAKRIALFNNDRVLREELCHIVNDFHKYLSNFHVSVRILYVFVRDLPKNIFGKTIREVYTKCTLEEITATQEFKECIQLLNLQSKVTLVESIKNAIQVVKESSADVSSVDASNSSLNNSQLDLPLDDKLMKENFLKTVKVNLMTFLRHIDNASHDSSTFVDNVAHSEGVHDAPVNRYKLKEKLLKATRVERLQSEFELVRGRLVEYLHSVWRCGLRAPRERTLHEALAPDDAAGARAHVLGSPRGAVHLALTDPHAYLQCRCCAVGAEGVSPSLPDVCGAYKLHRECGHHINLYDWLQAFVAVLQPDHDHEQQDTVPPHLQARFSQAVAELQFLGFIKASKRKTDHVMRLTW